MSAEQLGARLRLITNMLEEDQLSQSQIDHLLRLTEEFVPQAHDTAYMLKCMFLGWYIMENMKIKPI